MNANKQDAGGEVTNPDNVGGLISYDPESGKFRWLVSRGPIKAGALAGSMLGEYWAVRVLGRTVLAHRLAFTLMTGEPPSRFHTVDHIDGDKLNNRWANLRLVTQGVNNQNLRKARSGSKSGLIGAHWNEREGKWQSGIRVDGRMRHLGKFTTAQEAHEAYVAAKRELHPGCTL